MTRGEPAEAPGSVLGEESETSGPGARPEGAVRPSDASARPAGAAVGHAVAAGPAAAARVGAPAAPLLSEDGIPSWLRPVADAARTVAPHQLSRFLPPERGGRPAAVLVLFGDGPEGPHLLLTERAGTLRQHAGQPSFPGGSLDPEDGDPRTEGPLRAALREAEEETGLDPAGVRLFAELPRLYIPFSDFVVTPVLGWWHTPSPVAPVDLGETARVFTVPVSELTDPAHRGTAVHPSGYRGPCFDVRSALVWGFTAGIIDRVLHYAGWEIPWDRNRHYKLDGGA